MKRKARLKRHARIIAGQSPPSSQVGDHDEHVLPFLQGNAEFTTTSPVPVNACDTAPKRASAGDILLSVRAPVGALNIADRSYGIGRGLCAIRSTRADQRFLWWALQDSVADLQSRATGSTYEAVSVEDVANTLIPTPPLTIQRAIADYLDTETGRIDALITKKRRMIELLKERWRATIMRTLFADADIRWGTLRHIIDLLPGYAFPSSSFVDEGIRLLRGINVAPGRIRWNAGVVHLEAGTRRQFSDYELAGGDLVLGMDGTVVGAGVRIAVVGPDDLPCLLVQRVARLRPTENSISQYVRFLIESDAFAAYINPITTGITVPHISADQILSFRIPLPPKDTQRTLATGLLRERGAFSVSRDLLRKQIGLMEERRRALITSVVTGELTVPGVAV